MPWMWSTTSLREKSSTHWLRNSVSRRPGMRSIQSGWARYRSESGLTISGSIHRPNFMPSAVTFSESPLMPLGSTSGAGTQSPSPARSVRRAPNQPSSSTNISMPHSRAFSAIFSMCSSLMSNSVASQLLMSIGRGRSRQGPRTSRARYSRWKLRLMPFKPSSE